MQSLLIVHEYSIPNQMIRWLQDEINKLNKRAWFHKQQAFVLARDELDLGISNRVWLSYWPSNYTSYSKAARLLCEAAQRGEQVVVKFPRIAKSKSQFVGKPGEKLSLDVEVYGVFQHNGFYGLTFIHKIRDTDGNELVWFSQGKKVEEGVYHMTAKVHQSKEKAHSEFFKTKQTRITHCKFEPRKAVTL